MPSCTPLTDDELVSQSPFLSKLSRRRLAPVRLAQLFATARAPTPPAAPEPWECCGSSCKPCVRELWKEEMRVWDECHPDGPDVESDNDEDEDEDEDDDKGLDGVTWDDGGSPRVEIAIEARMEAVHLDEASAARAARGETPKVEMTVEPGTD
ncbi:hypothetical protein JCM11491_005554 [Sporobolomyces phaffii]